MNKYLLNIRGQISVIRSNLDASCVRRKKNQRNEKQSWAALNATAKKRKTLKDAYIKAWWLTKKNKHETRDLSVEHFTFKLKKLSEYLCGIQHIYHYVIYIHQRSWKRNNNNQEKKSTEKRLLLLILFFLNRWKVSLISKLCCSIISLLPHIFNNYNYNFNSIECETLVFGAFVMITLDSKLVSMNS